MIREKIRRKAKKKIRKALKNSANYVLQLVYENEDFFFCFSLWNLLKNSINFTNFASEIPKIPQNTSNLQENPPKLAENWAKNRILQNDPKFRFLTKICKKFRKLVNCGQNPHFADNSASVGTLLQVWYKRILWRYLVYPIQVSGILSTMGRGMRGLARNQKRTVDIY